MRHAQNGALPRLHVGLGRVALGDRPAPGREPLAQLRLPDDAAQRLGDLSAVARIDYERVLAVDRHVAHRARSPRRHERQSGGRPLPERHAERLVTAHERERVGAGEDVAELAWRDGPRQPRGHATAIGARPELGLERTGSADLELRLSLRETGLREGVDQPVQVLVRHQPAQGQDPNRPVRAGGGRSERGQVGALQRDLHRAPGDAKAVQPLRSL